MKETDKIKMEINIAGERLPLTVPFLQQNAVRDSEKRVRDLFQSWTTRFPGKKPREILAMVAYQFAFMYNELLTQTDQALQAADALDERLSAMLRDADSEQETAENDEPEGLRTGFFTNY